MGKILDMALHKMKKLDCQGEGVVDLRDHFANGPDTPERRTSAAAALARCVSEMRQEFGDHFAMTNLSNELLNIRLGRK
jgi:hypothetical protein